MIAAFTRFDLGNLLTTPKRIMAPLAFVIVAGIFSPFPLMAIPTAAAVASLGVGTPFLNDERGRLDILYITLPIQRTTVVVGRYIQMVVWFIAAALIGTVTTLVMTAIRGDTLQLSTVLLTISLSFFAAALALAVQLPVFFALGFAKARAAMFIPIIVLAVLCSAVAGLGIQTSNFFLQAAANPSTPMFAVVIGVLALFISATIAARIYNSRQF